MFCWLNLQHVSQNKVPFIWNSQFSQVNDWILPLRSSLLKVSNKDWVKSIEFYTLNESICPIWVWFQVQLIPMEDCSFEDIRNVSKVDNYKEPDRSERNESIGIIKSNLPQNEGFFGKGNHMSLTRYWTLSLFKKERMSGYWLKGLLTCPRNINWGGTQCLEIFEFLCHIPPFWFGGSNLLSGYHRFQRKGGLHKLMGECQTKGVHQSRCMAVRIWILEMVDPSTKFLIQEIECSNGDLRIKVDILHHFVDLRTFGRDTFSLHGIF